MRKSLLFIALLGFAFHTQAQNQRNGNRNNSRNDRNPSLSFGFVIADPMENLNNHFGSIYPGLEGQLLFNIRQMPFEVGVAYGWNYLGSDQRDVALIIGEDDGDNIYASGSSQVSYDNQRGYAIGRFEPVAWRLQPYADLMVGLQRFSSTHVVERDYTSYSEITSKTTLASNMSLISGFGFGLKWKLNRWFMAETRYQYIQGYGQRMIAPSTVHLDHNGGISWDETTTKTTMQTFQVGLSLEF